MICLTEGLLFPHATFLQTEAFTIQNTTATPRDGTVHDRRKSAELLGSVASSRPNKTSPPTKQFQLIIQADLTEKRKNGENSKTTQIDRR